MYFEMLCSFEGTYAFICLITVLLNVRSVKLFPFSSCTVGWTRFHSQICQHQWTEGRTKTGFDQADWAGKKTGFAFVGFVYTRRRICQISLTCGNTSQDLWLLSAHRTFLRWIELVLVSCQSPVWDLIIEFSLCLHFCTVIVCALFLLCCSYIFTVAEIIHIYVSGVFFLIKGVIQINYFHPKILLVCLCLQKKVFG